MKVVGTAGHVDHGKSSLVKALTGIDPDRLKEEKTREMTIELGFAWFNLPNGETVSIIDVPGHRDFIDNMLSGAGGMNAVIFVIAADEGIMPQTREHLAILNLLGVSAGIIALTKCDLVPDYEWLELIKTDIRKTVEYTFLQNVPIIPVSSKTGSGLTELKSTLQEVLSGIPEISWKNTPRLSLDRVFSIKGFGTVATGTLLDGSLTVGDEITILPSGKQGRIRGIQTHNQKLERALPGSRVAVNISGLDVKDLHRGDLLTTMKNSPPSLRINAWVTILPDVHRGLAQNDEIQLFHLAAKRMSKVRIIGKEKLEAGDNGYMQIEFTDPLPAEKKDHFIIRYPSPEKTIGGGIILDTNVSRRYRQKSHADLERISIPHSGSSEQKLESLISVRSCIPVKEILGVADVKEKECISLISSMISRGSLIDLSPDEDEILNKFVITANRWAIELDRILNILSNFHKKYPLRIGMSGEDLRGKTNLEKKDFEQILKRAKRIENLVEENGFLRETDFNVALKEDNLRKISKFNELWNENPFSPPGVELARNVLKDDLLRYLIDSGEVIQPCEDVVFRQKEAMEMCNYVIKTISENGSISVVEFRDQFKTSRKFALAYLEYLDRKGVTVREGDARILKKKDQ